MNLIHIILVESALEPIPKNLQKTPLIQKHARKFKKTPQEMILEVSLHHTIIKRLENHQKRGRPDIIHRCLLYALNSPLNKSKLLTIHVHTINNKIIEINPNVRVPRNYNRFIGLIEQLFKYKKIPPKIKSDQDSLLEIEDYSLKQLIDKINGSEILILNEYGKYIRCSEIFKDFNNFDTDRSYTVLIGGFSKGKLSNHILNLSNNIIKIDPEPLDSLIVLSKIINSYENTINLSDKRINQGLVKNV
ncbi:MAG: 16S rRNA methyltransferase [Candidatus Lokiarchaeota archaeon]|nr:16S rRNA methyltransferase [Candidatus Lokiarchaeota archaeon]